MFYAVLSDLFQRVVSLNKWDQSRKLRAFLSGSSLAPGFRMLDFGCGTGLFAPLFRDMGLIYTGYDIEPRFTNYAGWLYNDCRFISSKTGLAGMAPFDFILANCCAHHISDDDLKEELRSLSRLLGKDGVFVLVDVHECEQAPSISRRLFLKIDRGSHCRPEKDLFALVEEVFHIERTGHWRSYFLLLESDYNPVYGDLVAIACKKRSESL
jgi:SAM-dependent methyltransferase